MYALCGALRSNSQRLPVLAVKAVRVPAAVVDTHATAGLDVTGPHHQVHCVCCIGDELVLDCAIHRSEDLVIRQVLPCSINIFYVTHFTPSGSV